MLKSTVFIPVFICCTFFASSLPAQLSDWDETTRNARGQTVYFNAWGGSDPINDYIRWAADQVKERYQVSVKHVKVGDIGEVVSRILA